MKQRHYTEVENEAYLHSIKRQEHFLAKFFVLGVRAFGVFALIAGLAALSQFTMGYFELVDFAEVYEHWDESLLLESAYLGVFLLALGSLFVFIPRAFLNRLYSANGK